MAENEKTDIKEIQAEHASQIKEHTLTHLAEYLDEFATNLEKKGAVVVNIK